MMATDTTSAKAVEIILYSGVVLCAILALGFVMLLLRRRHFRLDAEDRSEGLLIDQIEAMHRAGQISDEEFSRLRRSALGLPLPAPRGPDGPDDDEEDADGRPSPGGGGANGGDPGKSSVMPPPDDAD